MKPLPVEHPKPRAGPAGKSPTERTLGFLRDLGFEARLAERRVRWNLSVDLFGIIDIVALTPYGVLGVQSTGSDFAGHLTKLTQTRAENSAKWLRTPGTGLMLIGWRKVKKERGKEIEIWAPRVKMITLDDLMPALIESRRMDLLKPLPAAEKPLWELYLEE